jgi:hypothetical protein
MLLYENQYVQYCQERGQYVTQCHSHPISLFTRLPYTSKLYLSIHIKTHDLCRRQTKTRKYIALLEISAKKHMRNKNHQSDLVTPRRTSHCKLKESCGVFPLTKVFTVYPIAASDSAGASSNPFFQTGNFSDKRLRSLLGSILFCLPS